MNKKRLIIMALSAVLLGYSAVAYYFTRGIKIYSISTILGKILAISNFFTFVIGLALLVVLLVIIVKSKKMVKSVKLDYDNSQTKFEPVENQDEIKNQELEQKGEEQEQQEQKSTSEEICNLSKENSETKETQENQTQEKQSKENKSIAKDNNSVCPICNATIKEGVKFCTKCGANFSVGDK